jgi:MerR family transcriptional regulator, light-induced transcriptional regulator
MSQVSFTKFATRVAVAERIAAAKRELATEVNDEFFRRHPEWEQRYGAAGVQRGFEDACYHLDYLAAAVETASTALFEAYARWTGRVLQSRGIASVFVVENFQQIESALQARVAPAEFACLEPLLRAGIEALLYPMEPAPPDRQSAESTQLFRTALLLGRRSAAVNIALEAIANGARPADVYLEFCSKALWQIGELWEGNQISVADEHRATAIVQYVIAQIYPRIPLQSLERGRVVVTGVEGEMHQLGANILADLLESEGWNVCFLGTNLPHSTILQKITAHRATAVFISATMPFNLTSVRRLVADIRNQFGPNILIVVGGQAFAASPSFFQDAGADAFAENAPAGAALLMENPGQVAR